MARPYDRGKVEVSESFGTERRIPQEERPFNIALLGIRSIGCRCISTSTMARVSWRLAPKSY